MQGLATADAFWQSRSENCALKAFLRKGIRKCCFPLLWSPESGQLQPFQAFGDFGDKRWPAEALRFDTLATADPFVKGGAEIAQQELC